MTSTSRSLGLIDLPSIEERRACRLQLTAIDVHKVLSGSELWRFHYCIAHVVTHGEIWAPWLGDNLSFLPSSQGDVACFWPHEAFGVRASRSYRNPVSIDPIPLDIWIDTFLDEEMRRDGLKVMLCPSGTTGVLRSVDEVFTELAACLSDQGAYWRKHFSADQFVVVSRGTPSGRLPE